MKTLCLADDSPLLQNDFLFGIATSSFQIEGSATTRLPCIWDTFCQQPGAIADASDGLVACEHIERWEEDIAIIAGMGVDAYRFSISWPRVMHADGSVNPQGVAFYQTLISRLNELGIKPFVTLYHWDLPQYLEDEGGWVNRSTAFAFADYVRAITRELGDAVYSYATFNEPFCSAYLGYEIGVHAPGKKGRAKGRQAAHHILLAHGLAMQVMQETCPTVQKGIVLNFTPCYPVSDSPADVAATQDANEYINLWYLQPLLEGSYPAVIDKLSAEDVPHIEPGDFDIMQQPLDFLGVNYYTRLTYSAPQVANELYTEHAHRSPTTAIGWEIYPQALTEWLVGLNQRYTLPPIYITENGAAMDDHYSENGVEDNERVAYFQQHLDALAAAMQQGVCIKGYFAWTLMDNFEWAEGYLMRFGLVYVDFATQRRTLKRSGLAYQALLKQRPLNAK